MSNSRAPILSICIPTYNRPADFKNLLLSLIPQLDERVELVVRDDSSTDATWLIWKELTQDVRFISNYIRGEKIGLDAANLLLLESAQGDFVWWFSDDDLCLPGAISEVFRIIASDRCPDVIWANYAYEHVSRLAVDRDDGFFQSGSEALEEIGVNIGLLSTYIVKREAAIRHLPYARMHVHGMAFASTAIVVSLLAFSEKIYFLRGPYVLCNPALHDEFKQILVSPTGVIANDAFNAYGVYFHDMIMGLAHRFDRGAVRILIRRNFRALWKGMVVAWVGGWDTPHGKKLKMLRLYWRNPECWLAIFIFLMPRWFVGVCLSMYRYTRR